MAETATTGAVTPANHSKGYWALSDSWVLIKRSIMHITKSPDQLLAAVLQPIMFTVLFLYVFGGAIKTGGTSYVNFLIAGILVQTAAFGATTTALGVAEDMQKGIIDRFKSLPMLSSAVLTGHVVADLARNTISAIIMIAVALVLGFRPEATPLEWAAILGILLLFTLAISWLSAILGLMAKSVEAVQWFSFLIIFPLTFASSAFVPTEGMVDGLRIFAENQPVTHVINAIRALMIDGPIGDHGWLAVAWCLGILLVSIPVAVHLFGRKIAR